MKKKYFGTDGIRGKVNGNKINGDMFFKFGLAAGTYFNNKKKTKQINFQFQTSSGNTKFISFSLSPTMSIFEG